MTEKRFIHKNESIINTQTDELVNASSEESAEIITIWLNELVNDVGDLRKENYGLLDGMAFKDEVEIPKLSERISDLECENEQLKQVNRNLGDFRNFITEKNVSNEKQRKELQLQMLRLYNYFENYFEDAMGSTAFSEMWDNVKEDEKWEKR